MIEKVAIVGMGALGLMYGAFISDQTENDAVFLLSEERMARYGDKIFTVNGKVVAPAMQAEESAEPADLESAAPLENAQGDVELSHVSFGYQKDQVILKDFSMKAPKGSLIAIVGPTGAGKTTFINLLMRFYDIDSGSILVDGRNISDITRKSLRLSYSMVLVLILCSE